MSLRAFHVFFIAASVLLAVFFAAWLWASYRQSGNPLTLASAAASAAIGAALLAYGRWFYVKSKRLGHNP